jgi:hypothetical protein
MSQPEPLNGQQLAKVNETVQEIIRRMHEDRTVRTTAMTMALQALQNAAGEWTPQHLVHIATSIHGFLTASAVDVGDTVADATATKR